MKKNRKIYIVGGAENYGDYVSWILPINYEICENINLSDTLMFCGGEDINPKYLNEECGSHTYFNNERDKIERDIYFKHVDKKDIIATCRGLQNISYLNGSKLIQHSSHPSWHNIKTYDGKTLSVISGHHQQALFDERFTGLKEGKDYLLIGYAENLSPFHLNGADEDYNLGDNYKEIEIVWIEKSRALIFQTHLEWMPINHESVKYGQDLIRKFLF